MIVEGLRLETEELKERIQFIETEAEVTVAEAKEEVKMLEMKTEELGSKLEESARICQRLNVENVHLKSSVNELEQEIVEVIKFQWMTKIFKENYLALSGPGPFP